MKGGTHTRRNKRTKKLDLEDLKDRQNIRKNSLNIDRFFKVKAKAITLPIDLDIEAPTVGQESELEIAIYVSSADEDFPLADLSHLTLDDWTLAEIKLYNTSEILAKRAIRKERRDARTARLPNLIATYKRIIRELEKIILNRVLPRDHNKEAFRQKAL